MCTILFKVKISVIWLFFNFFLFSLTLFCFHLVCLSIFLSCVHPSLQTRCTLRSWRVKPSVRSLTWLSTTWLHSRHSLTLPPPPPPLWRSPPSSGTPGVQTSSTSFLSFFFFHSTTFQTELWLISQYPWLRNLYGEFEKNVVVLGLQDLLIQNTKGYKCGPRQIVPPFSSAPYCCQMSTLFSDPRTFL